MPVSVNTKSLQRDTVLGCSHQKCQFPVCADCRRYYRYRMLWPFFNTFHTRTKPHCTAIRCKPERGSYTSRKHTACSWSTTTIPTKFDRRAAPLPFAYVDADSSEGELGTMSPLEKIAREMDQLEEEKQDRLGALSPTSSRASSASSRSSNGGRKVPSYRYDKAPSSRASEVSYNDGTEFSFGVHSKTPRESVSVRSTSSFRSSALRKEILRSPEETQQTSQMDLFPYTRARLRDVPFRTPHYGQVARTPDILRQEMLSVVFGWNDDIESLVRDECEYFTVTLYHAMRANANSREATTRIS
jgi:hypothetical protein